MSSLSGYESIVRARFLDIVQQVYYPADHKLRLIVIDDSYVDLFLSLTVKNIFAFHWERWHIDQTIFRYDNYPHKKWQKVKSYPYHLHYQSEARVIAAPFHHVPDKALVDFLEFVRAELKKRS